MSVKAQSTLQRPWLLYLLECTGNKLYAGISPDPEARFQLHLQGAGAKYTRANPPLRILAAQIYPSRSAATAAEHKLKKMQRAAKLLWAEDHPWRSPVEPAAKKRNPSAAKPAATPS